MMKKLLLSILFTLLPMLASAEAVEIDGIYYNLNIESNQAEVTSNLNKYSGDVTIPDKVTYESVEYSVTSVGYQAFRDCAGLTSIAIPNSVTSIGDFAFYGCSGLTSIAIPSRVTSIGKYSFMNCLGLTSIIIPNSVTSIGYSAFVGCRGITSVTIPNSVTSIDGGAFGDCTGLTSIKVESGNPKYDSRKDCNAIIETSSNTLIVGIISTVIPNNVTSIGERAFDGCRDLESISIPNSVTSIGRLAFCSCWKLTSITLPNSLTSIGSQAFFICSGLTSITIPSSVTNIGWAAFSDCSSLRSIKVEKGNPKYDSRNDCNAVIETSSNTLIAGCKRTIIPNDVTSIGDGAFYECRDLTSITIPNSVTSINFGAFDYCRDMTSIIIGNGVTYIGEAGLYCPKLNLVVLETGTPPLLDSHGIPADVFASATLCVPAGTKTTYQSAEGWKRFQNIIEGGENVPAGIEFEYGGLRYKIGENNTVSVIARRNSYGRVVGGDYSGEIVIPEHVDLAGVSYKVTSIEDEVFRGCNELSSAIIPNSVTSIGYKAFTECDSLTSVTIGNSVTTIGDAAFEWSELTTVNIPNSVTSIGIYAFAECPLAFVVSEIENPFPITNNVFKNCYPKLIVPKGTKAKYQATEGWNRFTIIEDGDEGSVFEADGIYYKRCKDNIVSVSSGNTKCSGHVMIPEKVTYMGITYDVTSIDDKAFSRSSLTSITMPNSIISIGFNVFNNCSSLTSITIPSSVTNISYAIFYGCDGLTSIKVESGNQKYDSRNNSNAIIETSTNTLFVGCKNTVIPNSVTTIGQDAFGYCKSLTSITIPSSVTTIGMSAFAFCTNLSSITIPTSVTTIGGNAFENCRSLTSITIPSSVRSIGSFALRDCSELTSISVDSENAFYDSRNGCNALIETSSNTLMAGCKNTVIPDGVKSISWDAFCDCGDLKSITIPSSVTSIDNHAFWNCRSLASVITEIENPFTINDNVFAYIPADAQLIVPKGTKAKYQATEGWKKFTSIVEMSGVEGDANNDGVMNDSDVNDVESLIMGEMPPVFVRNAADMNGDGEINVVDIVLMQNIINRK